MLAVSFTLVVLGFAGYITVFAATAINLNTADSFAVLAGSGITNTGATTIIGDIGTYPTLTETGFGSIVLTGTNYIGDATTQGAKTDLVGAYNNALGQATSTTVATELGSTTLGAGVYDSAAGTFGITGTLTLNGGPNDVFIFKAASTLITASNSHVHLTGGAQACNVFWQVGSSATIGTNSDFKGNILAMASITDNGGSTVVGRFLARDAAVTLNNTFIAKAICGAASASLRVTKTVINDNGGTKVVSNFPLFIDGMSVTSGAASTTSVGLHTISETSDAGYTSVIGGDCDPTTGTITLAADDVKACTITNNDIAPQLTVTKVVVNDNNGTKVIADFPLFINGMNVTSGIASTTSVGSYTVSETSDSGYTSAITGNCASNGTITLALGDVKICTITNDDVVPPSGSVVVVPRVPPLIEVVKVPSPLALPAGPGSVTYTYTLRNIGTVPVTNVTMVDDSCSPANFISGDANADAKLDRTETWIYRCTATLSSTHTNTVVATGWANNISTTDLASATVVVGGPVVAPLIHVTKIPSSLTLPVEGGVVTYTKKVTNPGTVALNNILITDDKCSPINYISGDINSDSKLDPNETWEYTCRSNLTKTTTNTAVVTGIANGLTARDFAIATVIVAAAVPTTAAAELLNETATVPKFPNTGIAPMENHTLWPIVVIGILAILLLSYVIRKKQII